MSRGGVWDDPGTVGLDVEETAGHAFADRPVGEWLAAWAALGPSDHARRAARAVYRGEDAAALRALARELRLHLERLRPCVPLPPVLRRSEAFDGVVKLLLEVGPPPAGGGALEAVLIPQARSERSRAQMQARLAPRARRPVARRPRRAAGCISTQLGCAVGCRFCTSGLDGLARNLRPAEIVAQALVLRAEAAARGLHLGSLVLMGMGEPFHNLDAVQVALASLTHPDGAQFGPGQVTVSTVGVPAGLERLASEGPAVDVALSLHAPDDAIRAELVPFARRLPPVAELLRLAADYGRRTGRRVTISYVLLDGVNDQPAHARALARRVAANPGLSHVNLIPFNPVDELPFARPPGERAYAFADVLRAAGIPTHVRRTRGAEAEAACGLLRRRETGDPVTRRPGDRETR